MQKVAVKHISTGEEFVYEIQDNFTIAQLKEEISFREGIPVDYQLLFTRNKLCLNSKNAQEMNLSSVVEKNADNIIDLIMIYKMDGGLTIDLFCCGCFSNEEEKLICCLGFGCGKGEGHCICEFFFSRCKIPCSIM